MSVRNDKLILICDRCLSASCWYGEFMCDDAFNAGIVAATVEQLRKLNRESEDFWTDEKVLEAYGEKPDFIGYPRLTDEPTL